MTNIVNTNLLPTASSNSTSIVTPESSIIDVGSENSSRNLQSTTTTNTSLNNNNSNTTTTTTTTTTTSTSQETCLICGDVASGKHYGLRSCEACKAFFKRTVQGKIEYSCPATKECEINKRRRKACQACRFQKCLNMGMLKEGVRLDRVRGGRQKYRQGNSPTNGIKHQGPSSASSSSTTPTAATAATSLTSSTLSSLSSSSSSMGLNGSGHTTNLGCQQQQQSNQQHQQQAQYHTPATSKQQHHNQHQSGVSTAAQNNMADQSFENQIMTALINCEPEELVSAQLIANIPSHLNLQMKTLYILSDLFDRELVSLIGWAKQIPGFSEQLTLNDQMRLLQSTWAEVIALSIGYRSYLRRLYGNGCNTTTTATPSPSSLSPASTSSYNSSSNNSSNCLHNSGTATTANNNSNNNNNLFEIRLAFAKDLAIDLKNAINCGAEEIFYNCAQLIKRLEYLKIKHQEYILLKAISLTNADVRLENPSATFRLRDLLMSALNDVTQDRSNLSTSTATPPLNIKQELNQPKDASSSTVECLNGSNRPVVNHRLNEILLCLPVLRQIDSSIRKFWNDIRKGPNNVPMNKLFEEMLEPCQRMYRSAAEI